MRTGDDTVLGAVLADVLEASHRTGPRDLPGLLWRAGQRLGLTHVWIYLADVQQEHLVALPAPAEAGQPPGVPDGSEVLGVDTSLAGRAYRTESTCTEGARAESGRTGPEEPGAAGPDPDVRVGADLGPAATAPTPPPDAVGWVPLVDGIGRLGVLRVTAPALDDELLRRCRTLASVIALLVATKASFGDVLVRTVRTRPMTLQAELLWAFVPPRTIGTRQVTSSAVLEPAYEVGGDAFDHNIADRRLHLTLVDAMGHDLASGGCSAVALAACRSTRRNGGDLADIARAIDTALVRWIPDRLLTCVIADLDTVTGELAWINCGHPPPLLVRGRRVVPQALERPPYPPLGLPTGTHQEAPPVHTARLEPGDRILVHSDGVTEARDPHGRMFGEQQLVDTVVRAMADGLPAPEALRRLMQRITAHQGHRLRDDATILLADWHPDH